MNLNKNKDMENINRIELSGVVGTSREINVNGSTCIRFSLAVESDYNGAVRVDWFPCVYWLKEGETAERFCKGARILVKGRMRTQEYCGESGETRRFYEVYVNDAHSI